MKNGFEKTAKIVAGIVTFTPFIVPVFFVLSFVFFLLFSSCGNKKTPVAEPTSAVVTTEEPTTEETMTEEPTTEFVTLSPEEISSRRAEKESRLNYLQSIDEYDEIIEIGYEAGHESGYEEGYREGYDEGYDDGYDAGSDAGYEEGYYRGLYEEDD